MPDSLAIPDVNADPAGALAALTNWYTREAWRHRAPQPLVAGTCERLRAAGVPLYVFNAWIMTLHPDFFGVVHSWREGVPEIQTRTGSYEVWNTPLVQNSPLKLIRDGADAVRWRLEDPTVPRDYPVLEDYAAEGATDYVAMRLPSRVGRGNMISIATKRPGGFTAAELALVDGLLFYMSSLTDIQALDYLASTLLDTYVGKDAGHEIMAGRIRRGNVESVRAVIWLCDLRDFTRLSDTIPGPELIALLNDYFDCVGKPVRARGGEILKFIGDAMLAIFRIGPDGDAREACALALAAADEAFANLDNLNQRREEHGAEPIRFGIALHIGEVQYGNIGAADRLDFTVIGPAVNLAARIEGLCPQIGQPVIVSAAFAEASGAALDPLGEHRFKGVPMPQAVFAPKLGAAAAASRSRQA